MKIKLDFNNKKGLYYIVMRKRYLKYLIIKGVLTNG